MVVFCSVESPLSQADTIEAVQFDRVFATAKMKLKLNTTLFLAEIIFFSNLESKQIC